MWSLISYCESTLETDLATLTPLFSDRYTRPLPPNRYEELEASGSFSALEAPSSPTKGGRDADALPGVKLGVITAEESSLLSKRGSLDGDDEEKEDQRPWNRSGAGQWAWNMHECVSHTWYTTIRLKILGQ